MPDKIIVGIHGLANKPPKTVLTKYWKDSIAEGLKKNCRQVSPFKYQMVYWADLLYKNQLHDNPNYSFDNLYNTEPYVEAKKGALKEHEDGLRDQLIKYAGQVSGKTVDILHGPLGMEKFAEWALGKVLKDLAFYYDKTRKIADRSNPPKMVLARKVLMEDLTRELLTQKGKNIMLIAHSMGSIIAYDVLRRLGRSHPSFEIAEFITMGSPLGLSHVKANIFNEADYEEKKKRVRTPSIVQNWVNYADRKDPVSFDAHLEDDYVPNKHGVKVKDDRVLNDYQVKKPDGKLVENHHKSYGYLRTPEVSRHIQAFLKGN